MTAGLLKYTVVLRHPDTLAAVALVEGQPVPKWAKDLVHEDDLLTEVVPGEDGEDAKPYARWKKADLEAEVESRNEDREDDDQIVVGGTGKVADFAAALDADDEATASGAGDDE